MPYKNPQQQKEYQQEHYKKNKASVYARSKARREEARESAYKSLLIGIILDTRLWNLWFNDKTKDNAKNVSYEISSIDAFDLMKLGCFYCGNTATTLDRLDSSLSHTIENCVGCCDFCNSSKGAVDPMTFILRAVYRCTFIYYEDQNIWRDNKNKPRFDLYLKNCLKQKRDFHLTKQQFDTLLTSSCHYCKRDPEKGKFFGVDKINPDDGYIVENVVSCCSNCNNAKWDQNTEDFMLRDMRITQRYLTGVFEKIPYIPKNIYHNKKHVNV